MTSPVDTSVKLCWSGMANAPVLSGQPGTLIGVLDACLVTGFDIKTLTSLTVADGVATATFAGSHSAQLDSVILVEGVTGALAGLNGEQKITAKPTASTLTFATAEADGTAAGAITIKMAPAGWAKPFVGTNKAVYTSTYPQSLGMFLRVDDSGTNFARVCGFETMLDVDTGTGAFPTETMLAGGGWWLKSGVANTAAAPWCVASDGRMLFLWISGSATSNASQNGGAIFGFGEPIALKPGGDAWAAVLSADIASNANAGGMEWTASGKISIARAYSGLGSAVWHSCFPYTGSAGAASNSGADATLGAFPNAVTGELYFSRRYISAGSGNPPRADVPGLFHVPQSGLINYFNNGDVVTAAGLMSGRRMFALRGQNSTGGWSYAPSVVNFIDQTGPWR